MSTPNRHEPTAALRSLIRPAAPTDDKYSRGVVGFCTGSERFPGAALLGVTAAMRAGIGLVRLLSDASVQALVLGQRPEVVPIAREALADSGNLPRCDAWVIGSGLDSDSAAGVLRLEALLADIPAATPVVFDATALDLAPIDRFGARVILTPHAGEAVRLLARFDVVATRDEVQADPVAVAQQLAGLTGAIVVLKGSRTAVAAPGNVSWVNDEAPAELATAGTGDVLAGLLGAMWAANSTADGFDVACAGVWVHSLAAAELAISGSIAALDLAEQLRSTLHRLGDLA